MGFSGGLHGELSVYVTPTAAQFEVLHHGLCRCLSCWLACSDALLSSRDACFAGASEPSREGSKAPQLAPATTSRIDVAHGSRLFKHLLDLLFSVLFIAVMFSSYSVGLTLIVVPLYAGLSLLVETITGIQTVKSAQARHLPRHPATGPSQPERGRPPHQAQPRAAACG